MVPSADIIKEAGTGAIVLKCKLISSDGEGKDLQETS